MSIVEEIIHDEDLEGQEFLVDFKKESKWVKGQIRVYTLRLEFELWQEDILDSETITITEYNGE
jgi:hypothetical protein